MDTRYCTRCGAALDLSRMSATLAAARCAKCGTLVDLGDASASPALDAPRPERFRVEPLGGTTTIWWRWASPSILLLAGFFFFWDSVMLSAVRSMGWFAVVLPHTWIGIAGPYWVLASALNRTRVEAGATGVQVQHGPLPWWGNRSFGPGEIEQLFVEPLAGKRAAGSNRFRLSAIVQGRRVPVVTVRDRTEAAFLEQQLERALGIRPRPITGLD